MLTQPNEEGKKHLSSKKQAFEIQKSNRLVCNFMNYINMKRFGGGDGVQIVLIGWIFVRICI